MPLTRTVMTIRWSQSSASVGYRYQGKSSWTAAHERYLRELVLPHPAMKAILEEYLIAIAAAGERIARCEAACTICWSNGD